MSKDFQNYCEQYVANKNLLTKNFAWSRDMINMSAALVLSDKNVSIDEEAAKTCEKIIKENKGALSEFRDHVKVPLICKMLASGNPEEYFRKVDAVYQILNAKKLFGNEYKIMAAMTICDHVDESDYDKYIDRTNEIYSRMKEEHPVLTSHEDVPFAAVLATSDLDVDKIISDMEACYNVLKKEFSSKDAVQSICEILALSDKSSADKCSKVLDLKDALKKAGRKFGTGYELATLGTLAISDISVNEAVELIAQADDYLKTQKGFGNFNLGRKNRRMFATELAVNFLSPEGQGTDVVISSSIAITVAMEVCLVVCIACSVAASSH